MAMTSKMPISSRMEFRSSVWCRANIDMAHYSAGWSAGTTGATSAASPYCTVIQRL